MQTRQLRLGDVVDDYCPRERRLSNHVIVAMVEDAIKQTRCSTCDFEHPYKDAKVPPKRKKKDAPSELFQQVLEGVMEGRTLARAATGASAEPQPAAATSQPVQPDAPAAPAPTRRRSARVRAVTEEPPAAPAPAPAAAPAPILRGVLRPAASHATSPATTAVTHSATPASESSSPLAASSESRTDSSAAATPASAAVSSSAPQPDPAQTPVVSEDEGEGPLYRRNLIRATLPRPVGEAPVRQMPSFTIREAAAARPGKFRHKQRPQGMGMVGPMTSSRQGRPNGVGGNQTRQAAGRGSQAGRPGGGKKGGGAPQHGNQAHGGKNRQGGQGNKRFK